MNYQQLTEGQRYQIALLYEDKFSLTEIGRRIGVNKSTISREVRRNRASDGYRQGLNHCIRTLVTKLNEKATGYSVSGHWRYPPRWPVLAVQSNIR